MKDLDRDSIDFGNGSIPRIFAQILLPTLFGMMFTVLFLLTDGIFVGKGIGSDALAAINIAMPVFNIATGFGMMFAMGASVVAAIHLSQDNLKAARINVTQAFMAALTLGTLLAVVLYAFPDRILRLLGCSDALMPICREYYLWFIPCALLVMLQIMGQFIIRLDGSPTYSMLVEMIPACLNIFLDWLFIFPMGMGLKGAALATDIGALLGVLMVLWYMLFRRRSLSFYRLKRSATSLVLTLRNIGYMAKLGFSGFLGEFAMSVLTLAGNYMFMKLLGEDGVASFSVACYLIPVIFMINAAIAQSGQPIISFNYGAGNEARVRRTLRISLLLGIGVGAIITLGFCLGIRPLVSIFLYPDTRPYDICTSGFPLYTLGFVFMAVCQIVIGFYQSTEKAVKATVLTVLRGMVFPVLFFLLLPALFGVPGLWLAVPASELLTVVAIGIMKINFHRQNGTSSI